MDKEKLQEQILAFMPDATVLPVKQYLTIQVDAGQIHKLAAYLNENPEMAFDYLISECAVDYPDHMMVVYHLDSTKHRHQVVIKAKINSRENPEIESVYDLWKGCVFHEREMFDLFGIKFINHPDLRKIFLDNDWVGYPMRKDYVDDVNIVER